MTLAPPHPSAALPAAIQALDALGDIAALMDPDDGTVLAATRAWAQRLAARPADADAAVGASITPTDALPGLAELLTCAKRATPHATATADDPHAGATMHAPAEAALGTRRQWQASAVRQHDGTVLVRLVDQQERALAIQRQLDDRERLLFTSRVISVGEMATTLAHEINQPIGAAGNLLRGLRSRLQRRPGVLLAEEAAALDRAVDQLMFASRVVARIREFTHSREPRQQTVDLTRLVRESAALLDWDLDRSGVMLEMALPSQSCPVRGDEVMLQQVLVNLMRNAIDAMRQHPPAQPLLHLSAAIRDGQVEVAVRDNGSGMDADAEQRLFVPFASTKPHGMGIGLSICRSFVELHQGRLWFSRNPERGCTFHLGLPLAPAASVNT